MDKKQNTFMSQVLQKKSRRRRLMAGVLAASMVVMSGVAWSLRENGVSYAKLHCGIEENHIHNKDCYEEHLECPVVDTDDEQLQTAENEESADQNNDLEAKTPNHEHTDDCYVKQLTCSKVEEHKHSAQCSSNADAVESEEDWKTAFKNIQPGEDLSAYLAQIASSQVGYRESSENFNLMTSNGTDYLFGYTRYGHWYENYLRNLAEKEYQNAGMEVPEDLDIQEYRYGDWDTLFVSFCLYYAGAAEMGIPMTSDASDLYDQFNKIDQSLQTSYYLAQEEAQANGEEASDLEEPQRMVVSADDADYIVKAGDIAFFDVDKDGTADYSGIVTAVEERQDDSSNEEYKIIRIVQGNQVVNDLEENEQHGVSEREYKYEDLRANGFMAFGILPNTLPEDLDFTSTAVESELETARVEIEDHETSASVRKNPDNTTINFFNYRVNNNNLGAVSTDGNKSWNEDVQYQTQYNSTMINSHSALKFGKTIRYDSDSKYNGYVGDGNDALHDENSIVEKTLGSNGYPVMRAEVAGYFGDRSLAYLFDPSTFRYTNKTAASINKADKYSVLNTVGLLELKDGYWQYNSALNYAELSENPQTYGQFTVHDNAAVRYEDERKIESVGQFFPFNSYEYASGGGSKNAAEHQDCTGTGLDHYFGMTLQTKFVQKFEGHTSPDQDDNVKFEFSGDDDVWIYIDGVLVADISGIHQRVGVEIDFATGVVTHYYNYSGDKPTQTRKDPTTLKALFEKAGKADSVEWSRDQSNTFKDNTQHELKMFYLERGGSASNLKIKFNLIPAQPNYLYKIDQYGNPVEGAEFKVVNSDNKTVYNAVTDSEGKFTFLSDDNYKTPMSLADMKDHFGERFTLVETTVPDGYRTIQEEIPLHFVHGLLRSTEPFKTGVWAQTTGKVIATKKLHRASDGSVISSKGGTLFAMVLKRNDHGDGEFDTWDPVIGNESIGYSYIQASESSSALENVVYAYKKASASPSTYGNLTLEGLENGATITMENLPGKIQDYYTYRLQFEPGTEQDSEYIVGYFYSTASSPQMITADNTVRVQSHKTGTVKAFDVEWGTKIEVPNIENHLLYQKTDSNGTKLQQSAAFALYEVSEDNTGSMSYIGYSTQDNAKAEIVLEDDSDGNNQGAVLSINGETSTSYTYTVDSGFSMDLLDCVSGGYITTATAGNINILDQKGRIAYVIEPARNANNKRLIGATHSDCKAVSSGGVGHFDKITNGNYALREVKSPKGFKINPAVSKVAVNNDGVFANAGTADDGITVYNGPGYLAHPMHMFASPGSVDETLTWITNVMQVNDKTTFDGVENLLASTEYSVYDGTATESHPIGVGSKSVTNKKAVTSEKDLLRNYMAYHNMYPASFGGLFDYEMNTDPSVERKGLTGINSLVLGAEEGWSTLQIFQDVAYGSDNHDTTSGYTVISDLEYMKEKVDISHLYARSTFVEISDILTSKVTLVKTSDQGALLDDAVFILAKVTKDDDGQPVNKYWSEAGEFVDQKSEAKKFVTASSNDKKAYFELPELEEGTYQLEETRAPGGYIPLTEPITVTIAPNVEPGKACPVLEKPVAVKPVVKVTVGKSEIAVTELNDGTPGDDRYYFDADGADYQFLFKVENSIHGVDVEIRKTDKDHDLLDGALFVLYKTDGEGKRSYFSKNADYDDSASSQGLLYTWRDGSSIPEGGKQTLEEMLNPETVDAKNALIQDVLFVGGMFSIKGLTEGEYFLREVSAPKGFNPLASDIKITVFKMEGTNDLTVAIDGANGFAQGEEGGLKKVETTGSVIPLYTFDVKNTSYRLPETGGGYGNRYYIVLGGIFAGTAVGYKLLTRRRKLN